MHSLIWESIAIDCNHHACVSISMIAYPQVFVYIHTVHACMYIGRVQNRFFFTDINKDLYIWLVAKSQLINQRPAIVICLH